MICPHTDFPSPKTIGCNKRNVDLKSVNQTISMNCFYKSLMITCPDETKTPAVIEDILREDSDYYKITCCSLTELVEPTFVENFVKKGSIYILSADRDCIVDNCVSLTPDGCLTLHLLDDMYQSLGLQGTKRPNSYYEVKIDLITLKPQSKVSQCLTKLESFNLFLSWESHDKTICPSSIAKYFSDRKIQISVHSLEFKRITPCIAKIPSVKDVDTEEMVEWLGMLALGGDFAQSDSYISSYYEPESEFSLKTLRISLLVVKGFITTSLVTKVCKSLSDYVNSRDLANYWASISVQSQEDCLWQWHLSSPKMFQAQNSSYNAFFTHEGVMVYNIGQLKYT